MSDFIAQLSALKQQLDVKSQHIDDKLAALDERVLPRQHSRASMSDDDETESALVNLSQQPESTRENWLKETSLAEFVQS